ncbi:serine/threonine-protein kinase [Wenzhouxiangella marina]|uniref:Protein kinase domain-containing protein n=1 Tax=Wenzhouxiangella marina TaxID=1579979 RepID=A0A0K0XVH9_9GAMM|nr:tetratricopeptide repeat protein [Wenzhouxiangella marina]AKS41631.1 hypothetical protein WM2015_1257 [Wenzhouxiangella marina]MBB6086609.1 tetratricopeptide (TPR) repeat protein [Wenzhouxiangella marina]
MASRPQASDQGLLSLAVRAGRLEPGQRDAFLRRELEDRPELLEQAESLVRLLEEATCAPTVARAGEAVSALPTIPGFELNELVGHGGMGSVYRARQLHPDREVAIKLIRADLMSAEARQRLVQEADLLGRLNHPSIARIHAAGTVDSAAGAQPWLAMELIDGLPLDAYLQSRSLSNREVIELIGAIADGVAHAHQQGVIHRDLKPANVLVDEAGHPHVLDFGVARLTDVDPGQASTLIQTGELVGTLGYMAPEQIDGRADTRSDIHALGVMLYQAFAGRLPIVLTGLSLIDALARLAQDEPDPLRRLRPDLDPELDALVMQALARDPDERYASVAQFREDMQRWLDHRPLLARSPGRWRRARLFVRRHRLGVGAAAAVGLAVLTGTALAVHFAWRESQARFEAELRAEQLSAVNQFIRDMLLAADPDNTLGERVTLVEALNEAARMLPLDQQMDPLVRAELHRTMGSILLNLGRTEDGSEQLDFANAIFLDHPGAPGQEPDLARIEQARAALEAGGIEAALELTGQLESRMQSYPRGHHVRNHWVAVRTRALLDAGQLDLAESLVGAQAAEAEEVLGASHNDTLVLKNSLAVIAARRGDHARELSIAQSIVDGRIDRFGSDHPQTLSAMNNLASALTNAGRIEAADALVRDTLARRQRVLGEEHPSTIVSRNNLAALLIMQGQAEAAEPEARAVLDWNERRLGPLHPNTLTARNILAFLLEDQGRLDEAEPLYREVLSRVQASDDDGLRTQMLGVANNLGMLLLNRGQPEAAVTEFELLLQEAERLLGAEHVSYAVFRANYGWCLAGAGRTREARLHLGESLAALEPALGSDHPRVAQVRQRLASLDG